jgi:hypothetical protein
MGKNKELSIETERDKKKRAKNISTGHRHDDRGSNRGYILYWEGFSIDYAFQVVAAAHLAVHSMSPRSAFPVPDPSIKINK